MVSALLALQFVVFGWRISREIALDDEGRRTWLFFSDFLNLICMAAVVIFCVVLPLKTGTFPTLSRATLGAGYVFICFTPLIIAGHYRLFSRAGRTIYKVENRDVPWMTGQEVLLVLIGILAAAGAACAIAAD